jgi:tetratricopeptide (TPR) repeat protein
MSSDEQGSRIHSKPTGDLLTERQAQAVQSVLTFLVQNEFDSRRITPQVPALVDQISSVCASPEDQERMTGELDRWVRWYRLPAYKLTFLFQKSMEQLGSLYFVAGCRLYAEAQINLNSDLSLPSLENGYNVLAQWLAQQEDPNVQKIANDLLSRMRTVYRYYRQWYTAAPYSGINQLTEHLYGEKTWWDLTMAFPELDKPRHERAPEDYLKVIDQCTKSDDLYCRVLARRFLGSVYEGLDKLDAAGEQFRLALQEAQGAGLDTEIGHLHRLYGYVLRNSGQLEEAAREFQRAFSHESHPEFSYWQALSARELADVRLRQAPLDIDPAHPPKELEPALKCYKVGRLMFEGHIGMGVLPIARAIKQQLFRSYVDNAVQVAMLSNERDSVAEIEASGPRYATEVVAESKAASALGADVHAKYQEWRAIFHQHLTTFNSKGDLDQDFLTYVKSVEQNREARQFYMKTRIALTSPITHAQLSDEITAKLFALRLPNVAFLLFHVGARQTITALVDTGTGVAAIGAGGLQLAEWQQCHEAYHSALEAAKTLPDRAVGMRRALEELLTFYENRLGPLFEALLPLLKGKHLKIFPRFSMNEVPLHALKVSGKPLIEHCQVSYGQSLGLFFQVHQDTTAPYAGTLGAIYDEGGTLAYKGTFRMLEAANHRDLSVLPNSSWDDVVASLGSRRPSDLFFACHGQYEPDDPTNSHLSFSGGQAVPFSKIFSNLDIAGCRSVTMGACESGLARTLVSAEYIGLPLAFFAAGAQYVIASLWQVNQIAAAILLGYHYQFLRDGKHTVVAALNEAQKITMRMSQDEVVSWLGTFLPEKAKDWEPLIRKMEDPPFGHPYYWAGFYISGDV